MLKSLHSLLVNPALHLPISTENKARQATSTALQVCRITRSPLSQHQKNYEIFWPETDFKKLNYHEQSIHFLKLWHVTLISCSNGMCQKNNIQTLNN